MYDIDQGTGPLKCDFCLSVVASDQIVGGAVSFICKSCAKRIADDLAW
jgi:hypothetical protein